MDAQESIPVGRRGTHMDAQGCITMGRRGTHMDAQGRITVGRKGMHMDAKGRITVGRRGTQKDAHGRTRMHNSGTQRDAHGRTTKFGTKRWKQIFDFLPQKFLEPSKVKFFFQNFFLSLGACKKYFKSKIRCSAANRFWGI